MHAGMKIWRHGRGGGNFMGPIFYGDPIASKKFGDMTAYHNDKCRKDVLGKGGDVLPAWKHSKSDRPSSREI